MLLGNTGEVEQRAMVMYDVDTGSRFNQASGIAIDGPLADLQLEALPAITSDLTRWTAEYPQSRIFAPIVDPTPLIERRSKLRGWDPADGVSLMLLVRVGAAQRAYPLTRLPDGGLLEDELGGEPIVILHRREPPLLAAFSRRVGSETVGLTLRIRGESIELVDRRGMRRWSGLNGRSAGRRHVPPLRPLIAHPITRMGLAENHPDVEVWGVASKPGRASTASDQPSVPPGPPESPAPREGTPEKPVDDGDGGGSGGGREGGAVVGE